VHRLRRYQSELAARQAAEHLKSCGIPAVVSDDMLSTTLGLRVNPLLFTGFDLFIPHKKLAPTALNRLAEFERPVDHDAEADDWTADLEPDLSLLDPKEHAIDCRSCGADLPLDSTLRRCPSCSAEADPVERVVQRHGPEALEHAYPHHDVGMPEAALRPEDIAIGCPDCGYDLGGLPNTSRCPECGRLFDKRDLLDRL
jgi:rubrerythrin